MKPSCCCLIALLVLLPVAVSAAGPHGVQFGCPYSNSGVVLLNDTVAQALADTGAGFVRLNFVGGNQSYDSPTWYAVYDGIVNRLRSRGMEVIGLVGEPWSVSHTLLEQNAYETTGGNGWNSYLNNWCNYFLRVATHFQGHIRYWELFNECDDENSGAGPHLYPSNFGAMLANAYDLLHTNNVPGEIISGGLCTGEYEPNRGDGYLNATYDVSINHTGWFTQMYNKWGTYPLDHIGYHAYVNYNGSLNTTNLSNLLDGVHNVYVSYEGASTQKKMFLTEVGWTTQYVSEALQASNLTGFFNVANGKAYIKDVNWFYLQDEPGLSFGVFRSTGLGESDKKPSWTTLKTQCTFEGRWSAGGTTNTPILNYFNARGHAQMGNPYDNGGSAWVHNWDFGPVQDYDGGGLGRIIVFDSADGVGCCVRGGLWQTYLNEHGNLEFPLGDQFFTGAGDKQCFEGGYMTWTQGGGPQVTLYDHKIPLDNSDAGFSASGSWSSQTASDDYGSNYRRRAATTTNADPAAWTISVPHTGFYYDVYAWWPKYGNASSMATYEIAHASGTATVGADQTTRQGRWNRLGGQSYRFDTANAVICLSSQGNTGKYVLADAVRLVGPVSGPDTTPPTSPSVTDDGQYQTSATQLHATWESQDMESGIDRYEYALGTSPADPGSGYLVTWTSTGIQKAITIPVTLTSGTTYYFYIRAYNRLGMMSAGVSNGIKVDTSAPAAPIVTDDGDYTGDSQQLHCSWLSSDRQSGIAAYEYSAGTSPYFNNLQPVTNVGAVTEVWLSGLNLIPGEAYSFKVRARNGAGVWSGYGYSGIVYQIAQQPTTIAQALLYPDSTIVLLKNKTISAVFSDRFFIEEADRSRGLAVGRATALAVGRVADVTGTLQISAGERVLSPGCVTPVPQ